MSAALECWSGRTSKEEEMVEQVLMRTEDRSEGLGERPSGKNLKEQSLMQKKLQRLSRNVSEALASLKNSLTLDTSLEPPNSRIETCRKHIWGGVVRNLTQLYPGSQLPERLMSNIRKHYDSLPLSYAQAGFDMEDVFLHIRLIEQAAVEDHPTVSIQEVPDRVEGILYKLTFACNSSISWPAMSGALESTSICCKKIQLFEKKGSSTLGIVVVVVQDGQLLNSRMINALQLALKKSKYASMKLPFGLCGCQEDKDKYQDGQEESKQNHTYSSSSFFATVNEGQTLQSSTKEMQKWVINPDDLEHFDQVGPNTFKGVYRSKRVAIQKVKGCDKGCSYEFELRKSLLDLMTCGHRNILQFYGVCLVERYGLCVVMKMMEGGSVQDHLSKKKLQDDEIVRIAIDIAEGLKFMNDCNVAYKDLNAGKVLLDRHGNACLGDMGVARRHVLEAVEYETDGYRWLAPEIIAGDPENVAETWMSNVYSFGMVLWEMVTGEAAYGLCSPVQAAVGITTCGLRPEIPKACPQILRSLMSKCWNEIPSKRPTFADIIPPLMKYMNA